MKDKNQYRCPYCDKTFDTVGELKEDILINHGDSGLPLPAGKTRLIINNEKHTVQVEPNWTLQYLIHDILGFQGSKQFCDRGACSSCTVIMNGKPVLSCTILAIECDGSIIETVEGIAKENHPLIETYVDNHAMQCGYCTPGFVVTSKALLDRNPNPTADEVCTALAGNLCRCGTYPQHSKSVIEASKILNSAKMSEEVKK